VFDRDDIFIDAGAGEEGAGDEAGDGDGITLALLPAVCQGDFEVDALSAGLEEKKSLVCRLAFLRSF